MLRSILINPAAPDVPRRIDGATPLEAREDAIREFNKAGSDVFVFLLSIRAAGRGLNLQVGRGVGVVGEVGPSVCRRRWRGRGLNVAGS